MSNTSSNVWQVPFGISKKNSPTIQKGKSGATGFYGFSWRVDHEEVCSVGEYLASTVRYVNRKMPREIEVFLGQVCYQTALPL